MRIIFNLFNVGLGNNGGSRTLIKSAETLCRMGHNVVLFINSKNNYTWERIDKSVEVINGNKMPRGDVIVATGIGSVKSTVCSNFAKKYYFIRGYEIWKKPKKVLLNSYRSLNCIVNSDWLLQMLKNNGINSCLVYNGLDFDDFFNMNIERLSDVGCLSQRKITKRYDLAVAAAKECSVSPVVLNETIKNPTPKKLNQWYNSIKVWLSTSELEGLHNPPMEASLSGCGLVANDHVRSGTSDYSIHNKTALVYEAGDVHDASNCIRALLRDSSMREELNFNMINLLKNKIGTRNKNMNKFLKIIGG